MQQTGEQLAVLVTASNAGDELRRELLQHGVALASSTASLSQLRRTLVRGVHASPLVLCITLDEPTLRRHGRTLSRILDDRASFATEVRSIGVIAEHGAADGWATLGCDVHAGDAGEIARLIEGFTATHAAAMDRGSQRQTTLGEPKQVEAGDMSGASRKKEGDSAW